MYGRCVGWIALLIIRSDTEVFVGVICARENRWEEWVVNELIERKRARKGLNNKKDKR